MTVKHLQNILALALAALLSLSTASCGSDKDDAAPEKPSSTKRERNAIKEGNELYGKQRYAEAEISYKKALEENPENTAAQFNLASSYLKQRGEDLANKGDSLVRTADAMMGKLGQAPQPKIAQKAFYDRGNIAYKADDYAAAIEHYKNALRRDPSDNQARENLRLAQLKKQEQDQNKDQNKDQNQDQNQQNQQDQQQQQQDQQQDKQQQLQQQQQQQNEDIERQLRAVQMKEDQTRRDKDKEAEPVYGRPQRKPW